MSFRNFAIAFIQPFLVSFYFLIRLFAFNNIQETYIKEFLGLNLFFVFIILLLLLVFGFILKSFFKASFFISILIVFLNFSSVFGILEDKFKLLGISVINERVLLLILLSVLLCVFVFLFSKQNNSILFARCLIFPFLALVVLSIINVYKFNKKVNYSIYNSEVCRNNAIGQNFQDKNRLFVQHLREDIKRVKNMINKEDYRDIYFIILDAYASNDILRKYFNYNNSEFLNKLKNMGFYIAGKSRSNYPSTSLSIPASFNMNYQNFFEEFKVNKSWEKARVLMNDSNVVNFLKLLEYKYFLGSSSVCFTREDARADNEGYVCGFGPLTSRIFGLFFKCFFPNYFENYLYRKQIYYQLNFLKKSTFLPSPKFVFTHIVCPHPPYAFNAVGENVFGVGAGGYIEQLKFITSKIEEIIESILENSAKKPIIILQADHGKVNYEPKEVVSAFDYFANEFSNDNKNKDFAQQIFGGLNAYYFPDNGSDMLYQNISPINNFRLIFKHYFGIHCNLLEDISYGCDFESPDFVRIF